MWRIDRDIMDKLIVINTVSDWEECIGTERESQNGQSRVKSIQSGEIWPNLFLDTSH